MIQKLHHQDTRLYRRLNVDFVVLLEHPDGEVLRGKSVDVSLGGVRICCNQKPRHRWLGETVTLSLAADVEDGESFKCLIRRQDGKYLALELDRGTAARFGLAFCRDQILRPVDMTVQTRKPRRYH